MDFVVELGLTCSDDEYAGLLLELHDGPLAGWVTVMPSSTGGTPLGAFRPELQERQHYLRVACPASRLHDAVGELQALLERRFSERG